MDKGLPVSDSGVIMEGGLEAEDIIMAVQKRCRFADVRRNGR